MADDDASVCPSDKGSESRKRNWEEEPRGLQTLVGEAQAQFLKAVPHLCPFRNGKFALHPATLQSDGVDYHLPQLGKWVEANPRPDYDTASPSTGLTVLTKFKPNAEKQKALFHLVQSGQLDNVSVLSEAVSEVKNYLAQLKRAWAGDLDAILKMVAFFQDFDSVSMMEDDGTFGGVDGPKQAMYFWISKAAEQDHPLSMAKYGTQVYGYTCGELDHMQKDEYQPLFAVAILNTAAQKHHVDMAALTMARMVLDGMFDGDGMPAYKDARRSAADLKRGALVQMERSLQAAISESLCPQKILSDQKRTKVRELLTKCQEALTIHRGGPGNLEDVVFYSYEFDASEEDFETPAIPVPCDKECDLKALDFYLGYSTYGESPCMD